MSANTVYLPRQHTRIGRAGYRGDNIETYEVGHKPPEPVEVEAPAPKKAAAAKPEPKTGIKPLKPASAKA